jgi:hypothetical protein
MDDYTVGPFPSTAHAYLGVDSAFHTFRFNPDSVTWSYKENISSQDTIGGRVVQLLSVQIEGISIQGRSGSRGELQRMSDNIRSIMEYHIKSSRPVAFRVPSRKWYFVVYVTAMPQIGWDVASTSYPYQIELAVEQDLVGLQAKKIEESALLRLAEGVGYQEAVHGGDPKGFSKIVDSVLAFSDTSNMGGGDPSGDLITGANLTNGPTTESIVTIIEAVKKMFPDVRSAGTYNCRTTASGGFSQHCAGNGWDIVAPGNVSDLTYLDQIYKFLDQNIGKGLNLPISQVIWRDHCSLGPDCNGGYVSNHMTHIHVSGSPYLRKCVSGCNP